MKWLLVAMFIILISTTSPAQQGASRGDEVSVDANGIVRIPAMTIPLSPYMSDDAKWAFIKRTTTAPVAESEWETAPEEVRQAYVQAEARRRLKRAAELYPVNISDREFRGVMTQIIEPSQGIGARNQHRILIDLHGGSYRHVSDKRMELIDALPIASRGRIRVVSVDYRTSPEYKFPAAVEDVIKVYRELLKTYRAENVGIYGGSTGAALTAVAVAWFQREKLPRPGAIGLFCEGAIKDDQIEGDSYYIAPPLMGDEVRGVDSAYPINAYMADTDGHDPYVAPVVSLDVLSRFPPTLLISGTRDIGLSSVLYTHARLTKAAAEAELHVWDGMWHGFFSDVDLPESTEAYDVIDGFFDRHLGFR